MQEKSNCCLEHVIWNFQTKIWIFLQSESQDGSDTLSPVNESEGNALKIKEWEVRNFQDEVAASQGIRIRRRPPTGPPLHYVGPFEFRIENEGNTPRNILEEIIWNKDKEVARVLSWFLNIAFLCLLPVLYGDEFPHSLCFSDEREKTCVYVEERS